MKRKRNRRTRAVDNHPSPASQDMALLSHEKPWRIVTRTIHQFPRCFAYLKAMRVKFDDPTMHDYWAAAILSDAFSDARLAALGTVNFDNMTGRALLGEFEKMLGGADRRKQSRRQLKPVLEVDKIKGAASEAEIIAAMTPKGGWKAVTLAAWGVGWPPPAGWRQKLVENFESRAG